MKLQCFCIVWSLTVSGGARGSVLQCIDYQGQLVADGQQFIPQNSGTDCKICYCENGTPRCYQEQCAPPPTCNVSSTGLQLDENCCPIYNCVQPPDDPSHTTPPGGPKDSNGLTKADNTNLGLRLVASTVTSFLILALLLYLIHRLRQRRMLIMMRRLHGERREEEAVAYMAQFDQVDIGITFPPYEDPPPPYSPPKPPDIPQGEAPPPYTETPAPQHTTSIPASVAQNGDSSNSGAMSQDPPSTSANSNSYSSALCEAPDTAQTRPKTTYQQDRPQQCGLGAQGNQQLLRYIEDIEPRNRILSSDTSEDISPGYGFSLAMASMSVSPSSSSEAGSALLCVAPRPVTSQSSALDDSYHSAMSYVEKTPSPRTQFIKRSDSIEIRRQSPRNSYMAVSYSDVSGTHTDDTSSPKHNMTHSCDTELLRRCLHGSINQTSCQSPETDTEHRGLSWVAEGGLGMRAFRIRRQESSPCVTLSRPPARTDSLERLDAGKQKESGVNCVSASTAPSETPVCQDELRRSLPPLDLLPSLNDSSFSQDSSTPASDLYSSGNNNTSCRLSPELSSSSNGPAVCQVLNGGLVASVSRSHSPASPQPSPSLLRSGSVMSQISVCSETGESKRPRPRYRGNTNSSSSSNVARQRTGKNNASATTPQLSASRHVDSKRGDCTAPSSSEGPGCCVQSAACGVPPPTAHSPPLGNTPHTHKPEPVHAELRAHRRIIYRDPDDECFAEQTRGEDRALNNSERTCTSNNRNSCPQKNNSCSTSSNHAKSTQNASTSTADKPERVTLRRLKQKRRPHSNPNFLPDNVRTNSQSPKSDDRKGRNRKSLDSPNRLRKASRGENTQYKEYGFIDNPNVLVQNGTEPGASQSRPTSLKHSPAKDRQRSKSRERNGNVSNGSPTQNGVCETSAGPRSRSRSRSRSRDSCKSRNKKTEGHSHRSRHSCRGGDREATKPSTGQSTEKRPHHKSRSPSRRKRQSTGPQYDDIAQFASNCGVDGVVSANRDRDRLTNTQIGPLQDHMTLDR